MTLKKIEEQIDALGFPSLVNFLRNDSTHPSDMKYVLDDVDRAYRQSSRQEFSKSDYNKVVKLVEQWFAKKHGRKINPDLDYLKAMVSIALNIKPDSEYISPTRQSQLADVARRLGFEWKYVKKVYKIDERVNGKLPKKNGVKMPRMKKNPINLGVRRIRSRYGVAGMIDGRPTSSSGVFKNKKQAERAIYYIESAFYDGTKGREYSYEEGRRYGYSAVDKYDQQGRLYDTVLADLTRKGAETLILLLNQANKAGLKSKTNPKPSRKAGKISLFTWRKLGFPINGKTAYVTQKGRFGYPYIIVKEGRKYALREFNSSLKLIDTFKTLAEAKKGFPKWLLDLESKSNPKKKSTKKNPRKSGVYKKKGKDGIMRYFQDGLFISKETYQKLSKKKSKRGK